MCIVKLPYYPEEEIDMITTRRGVVEISKPNLYEKPIKNKYIVRIDLQDALRPILGSNCVTARSRLYNFLSGKYDDADCYATLAGYYRRHSDATRYINNVVNYEDTDQPLAELVMQRLSSAISDYCQTVMNSYLSCGGKLLVRTHNYIYFAFNFKPDVEYSEGVKLIC